MQDGLALIRPQNSQHEIDCFVRAFLDDADRLWFIAGEVGGAGFDAALRMLVARTLFRAVAQEGTPAGVAFERMHRELPRQSVRARPVAVVAGCLNLTSGRLELANTGHEPPFVLRSGGEVALLADPGSAELDGSRGQRLTTSTLALSPGDALALCTNGIVQATAPDGEPFSRGRLEACLRAAATSSATVIVGSVLDAVTAFTRDASRPDDRTVVVIRLTPRAPTS